MLSHSFSNTPLQIHTHTHTQPPCWGSKWSKITHSATQSLLCLALGTECFIPCFFFSSSVLPPPSHWFCMFFHAIVTLLKQEPVMVNCLTFHIVRWCCAVWSVSTWFSPIHQEWFVILDTFLWWELEVLYVHYNPFYWHLSALDLRF